MPAVAEVVLVVERAVGEGERVADRLVGVGQSVHLVEQVGGQPREVDAVVGARAGVEGAPLVQVHVLPVEEPLQHEVHDVEGCARIDVERAPD